MAPPFFYQISQCDLVDYVCRLAREITLPIILYNNPALVKVGYDLDAVRELIENPELKIVGFKDSSGDAVYFQKLRSILSELEVPLLSAATK